MTADRSKWVTDPVVFSIRGALEQALTDENDRPFSQPNWSVLVRKRSSDGYAPVPDIDDWRIENPRYGAIMPGVFATYVDSASGRHRVAWDQYLILEGPPEDEEFSGGNAEDPVVVHPEKRKLGAVIVPWCVMIDPDSGKTDFGIILVNRLRHPVRNRSGSLGRYMLELPRGFASQRDLSAMHTGVRELLEETGYISRLAANILHIDSSNVTEEKFLGYTHANSAFYVDHIAVVACEVDWLGETQGHDEKDDLPGDQIEPFGGLGDLFAPFDVAELLRFGGRRANGFQVPLKRVIDWQRRGLIVDSLTQAALFMFWSYIEGLQNK